MRGLMQQDLSPRVCARRLPGREARPVTLPSRVLDILELVQACPDSLLRWLRGEGGGSETRHRTEQGHTRRPRGTVQGTYLIQLPLQVANGQVAALPRTVAIILVNQVEVQGPGWWKRYRQCGVCGAVGCAGRYHRRGGCRCPASVCGPSPVIYGASLFACMPRPHAHRVARAGVFVDSPNLAGL